MCKSSENKGMASVRFKSILEKGLDKQPVQDPKPDCYPRWNTKTYAAVSITTDTGPMMNHLYEQLTALKLTGFRVRLKSNLLSRAHTRSWASKNPVITDSRRTNLP